MKRILYLITCALILTSCKKYDDKSIIGTWKAANDDYPVLIFNSNNIYELRTGENYVLKNKFYLRGDVLTLKDEFDIIYKVIELDEVNLYIRMESSPGVMPYSDLYLIRQ